MATEIRVQVSLDPTLSGASGRRLIIQRPRSPRRWRPAPFSEAG